MRRSRLSLPVCCLLLLALSTGCDQLDPRNAPLGPGLFPHTTESGASEPTELATEDGYEGATRTAKWIGSSGGSLSLAGHVLEVPEGAVSQSLCFTMELVTGDVVDVDLHAWEMESSESCSAESGEKEAKSPEGTLWQGEFEVPVKLGLTYERTNNVSDPSRLLIGWAISATELELLSSSVDTTSETVWTELDHFSQYVLAMPD